MTLRVIDVCFVVLFLVLLRDAGGINLSWMQGGRAAARPTIWTKASTSIVITAEETSRYSHGALIYDRVVFFTQVQISREACCSNLMRNARRGVSRRERINELLRLFGLIAPLGLIFSELSRSETFL